MAGIERVMTAADIAAVGYRKGAQPGDIVVLDGEGRVPLEFLPAAVLAELDALRDLVDALIAGGGTTPVPPTLVALTLSSAVAQVGTAKTINILGAKAGSTLTGAMPDGMTLNSGARTIAGTPTVAGTYSIVLTETLAGAVGSPRQTTLGITVSAAPVVATLDNTLGTSTIAPATTVQNFTSAWGAPIRAAFAAKGINLSNDDSRAVNVIVADYIAAADATQTPQLRVVSIADAGPVNEGTPVAPTLRVVSIADATSVSEGTPVTPTLRVVSIADAASVAEGTPVALRVVSIADASAVSEG